MHPGDGQRAGECAGEQGSHRHAFRVVGMGVGPAPAPPGAGAGGRSVRRAGHGWAPGAAGTYLAVNYLLIISVHGNPSFESRHQGSPAAPPAAADPGRRHGGVRHPRLRGRLARRDRRPRRRHQDAAAPVLRHQGGPLPGLPGPRRGPDPGHRPDRDGTGGDHAAHAPAGARQHLHRPGRAAGGVVRALRHLAAARRRSRPPGRGLLGGHRPPRGRRHRRPAARGRVRRPPGRRRAQVRLAGPRRHPRPLVGQTPRGVPRGHDAALRPPLRGRRRPHPGPGA